MLRAAFRFALGMAASVLALEAALHVLPVTSATQSGYHHDPEILTYPSGHSWQVATGWDLRNAQLMRANNWGFAAHRDFGPDPRAVALIGDSFVEASMLPAGDRPGPQLEALLGGTRPVFALGGPGSSLLDYAQRIRLARMHFDTRDFVILVEKFDARQAVCGSHNNHGPCLDAKTLQLRSEHVAPPSLLKRVMRHSALAQYIGSQLKFQPAVLWRAMFTGHTPDSVPAKAAPGPAEIDAAQWAQSQHLVNAAVEGFFAAARPHVRGRLVVLVDGQRKGPPAHPELIDRERQLLIQALREHGAIVHDLEPLYAQHARNSPRRLDVGPYDGHLNPVGVRLAMHAAVPSLQP